MTDLDRATVVTTAILQIVTRAFRVGGSEADLADVRAEITALLRDEFDDIQRQTRDDIRLRDD